MKFLPTRIITALGAAILATACLGFGSWGHKATDRATNVTFASMMKFNNGETLPAGTYRMEVPKNTTSPKVEFYKDGKLMATAHARVVNETNKNQHTEIDSVTQGNAQLVNTIRPHGWNERLDFSHSASTTHGS